MSRVRPAACNCASMATCCGSLFRRSGGVRTAGLARRGRGVEPLALTRSSPTRAAPAPGCAERRRSGTADPLPRPVEHAPRRARRARDDRPPRPRPVGEHRPESVASAGTARAGHRSERRCGRPPCEARPRGAQSADSRRARACARIGGEEPAHGASSSIGIADQGLASGAPSRHGDPVPRHCTPGEASSCLGHILDG